MVIGLIKVKEGVEFAITQEVYKRWQAIGIPYGDHLIACANRYLNGDWGDMVESDKVQNDLYRKENLGFVMGAYHDTFFEDVIWIGQSLPGEPKPTILHPSEY